jgi:signal transduction histidine kinase
MRLPGFARLWQPAAFAAGLFLFANLLIAACRQNQLVAGAWPVDGLAVAFLVRWAKTREERGATLALFFVAIVCADLLGGSDPRMALAMAGLDLVNILAADAIVRRFGRPMDGLPAFCAYALGSMVVAPALTGAAAALMFGLAGHAGDLFHLALRWAFATGIGMAVAGNFALTVRWPRADETAATWMRFAAGQALVVVGAALVLLLPPTPPLFLLFPLLVAGALSHRELGGVTAVGLTAVTAVLATVAGRGPAVVAVVAHADKVQVVQALVVSMALTVLPISALLRRLDAYARELDGRRARAEEQSAVKTRLLAHVSHEIRSPLSGVTGLAELMRDGALGQLTPAQRDTMGQILSTGAEVDQLARDLVDALAIQSGAAHVKLAPTDPGEAIAAAVNLARFRMSQHEARIEVAPGSPALRVAADPLRLRQILVNLLVNAAKYGGRPPLVRVSAIATGAGSVRFQVEDNGRGVPVERRPALFQDFERLGAEASGLEGSGLGLALSYQIARLQNGALGVDDSGLGGALFWVELPLWSEAVAAA